MLCIIQCRSDSKRFPDKYKYEINGKSIIQMVYDTCSEILPTIVAIPSSDKKLMDYLSDRTIPFFLGSKSDVLGRLYHCAIAYKADSIVRVTGDCCFISPATIFYITNFFKLKQPVDIVSNVFEGRHSYDGDDCEVISLKALKTLHNLAASPSDRENVTTYFYRNKDDMNLKYIGLSQPLNLSRIKASIDTLEDIETLKTMRLI